MYKSPIEIIQGQMKMQMEGDIYRAVQSYDINVDKAELLRALKYDRDQYLAGYRDGKADEKASIVRCKDCRGTMSGITHPSCRCLCERISRWVRNDDFCSWAEKRPE